MPADKGRATVVMDNEKYEEQVKQMLPDTYTYEVLPSDPTNKYKKRLIGILSRHEKEDKITKSPYENLYPTSETVPRIYCTPKVHKKDILLRPIVDYTGSIGYNTSRALADLLGPLVGLTKHHAKIRKSWPRIVHHGDQTRESV